MDNVERLKLSNEVSMKVLKNDFPINGKTSIVITIVDNQPATIEVRNTKAKAVKED